MAHLDHPAWFLSLKILKLMTAAEAFCFFQIRSHSQVLGTRTWTDPLGATINLLHMPNIKWQWLVASRQISEICYLNIYFTKLGFFFPLNDFKKTVYLFWYNLFHQWCPWLNAFIYTNIIDFLTGKSDSECIDLLLAFRSHWKSRKYPLTLFSFLLFRQDPLRPHGVSMVIVKRKIS
jgi:hypothetical protein